MGQDSKIQWTDGTWTPLRARIKPDAGAIAKAKGYTSLVNILEARKPNGDLRSPPGKVGPHCEHVSHGCDHCYSDTNNGRCLPANGTGLPFDRRSRDLVDVFVDEKILTQPLRWKKPQRIFVCSQTDLFGEFVTDEMIERVFAVMALCPQHTFQCLTKRPARMLKWFTSAQPLSSREEFVMAQAAHTGKIVWDSRGSDRTAYFGCGKIGDISNRRSWPGWPLLNVHLGVSVEDQPTADERIILIAQTPAAVRFVSAEPLLGPVDLCFPHGSKPPSPPDGFEAWSDKRQSEWFAMQARATYMTRCEMLDWVIVGGESGPGARPCDIAWIRSIVAQCAAAGTACFVKQLGPRPYDSQAVSRSEGYWPITRKRFHRIVLGAAKEWALAHVLNDRKGGDPAEWPADLRVRELPDVIR